MAVTYGSSGLGLGAQRRLRRRRFYGRLARVALVLAALGTALGYAYQVGASKAEAVIAQLREEIERLQASNVALGERLTVAAQAADAARTRARALEQRYAVEVPQGIERELLARVERQLAAGVPPERLAFLIEQSGPQRECAAPETRRFVVRTPINQELGAAVGFAGGRVVVGGDGTPARNAQGLPEAWFDPGEPVTLRFRTLDGRTETVEGVLPLHHAMAVGGREYRFSVTGSDRRGFVDVAAQSCAFP